CQERRSGMDVRTAPLSGGSFSPHRIADRMIPGRDGLPALELIEAGPEGPRTGAPILFLHGAFGGAWMWREIFMPYFARRGRASLAVSVRGHGNSEGLAELRNWGLSDYLDDIRRVFAELDEAPVVIAHSLGGLLAQMLIGREPMRALALLGSLPPEGLMLESPRLAITDTPIWIEAFVGSMAQKKLPIALAAHRILFSEGLPRERVMQYSARMTPESPRALADAHLPLPVASAFLYAIPTLVMRGAEDRLVWQASALRTALYHGAAYRMAEAQGHFLQLDIGAETVARNVMAWIDGLDL
ncbi:MAG TPA: alpha/beta fold hydrolase, partial [Beijerinckiaceae bacterium]|nr:alpha/beta fold hydrolase [Beijerinckiaceae bacterium]